MRTTISFILVLLTSLSVNSQEGQTYRDKTVILKVKNEFRHQCGETEIHLDELNKKLDRLGTFRLFRKFPEEPLANRTMTVPNQWEVDLSLIYELQYEADVPVEKTIRELAATPFFEYVEPAPIFHTSFVPNDPSLDEQWHLQLIKAFEAWDKSKGSQDVTIAIVDTGVDWDHEDMIFNIQYNTNDPIDGIDNDEDGYIDNHMGWDLLNNDNDPHDESFSHGTHVAGLAGATVNNGAGVAGTGFNCRILPVKTGEFLTIEFGYEGIKYAADHGADVINCSWGGSNKGQFGQDVITYATMKKNALVVAGAGNDDSEKEFYPASYQFVLSVGGTDSLDKRASFSNYHYDVDLVAPGTKIFSLKNDSYGDMSGTSMSAPLVAGAAGVVKSFYPWLTAMQVGEQLKNTADNIYAIPDNQSYVDKLGSGRLNLSAALDGIKGPALELENIQVTDGDDEIYLPGDEITVGIDLVNYLGTSGNITVALTSTNPNIEIIQGSWQLPGLGENERRNNYSSPFVIRITGSGLENEQADLKFTITDGLYTTRKYENITINQNYVNVTVNDILTTVNSFGRVGYNGNHNEGLGFQLENVGDLLYEAGLMIGHSGAQRIRVMDVVRGSNAVADRNFFPVQNIRELPPPTNEAFYAEGVFNDQGQMLEENIGLEVHQKVFAWNDPGHENYIVVEYEIFNRSGSDLYNLYAGIFADWDIFNADENRGVTEPVRYLGYVVNSGKEKICAGIQVLSEFPFHTYMIDNERGGKGGVDMYDSLGFSTVDKYTTLTTDRFEAGMEEKGSDIIQITSTGGLNLPDGQSVKVAFALMAARNVETLLATADSAYMQYTGNSLSGDIYTDIQWTGLSPNPTHGTVRLDFALRKPQELSFELWDLKGQQVCSLGPRFFYRGRNQFAFELTDLPAGTYFLRVLGNNIDEIQRVVYISVATTEE